jgi:two-component system sensor histidine kinase FlrB
VSAPSDKSRAAVPAPTEDGAPPNELPEQRLQRLARLGELATGIAHELRNALQIVSANAYLAKQQPERAPEHLKKVEQFARVAQQIVGDVLSLARDGGPAREPVSLAQVLAEARAELSHPEASFEDDVGHTRSMAHGGLLVRCFRIIYDNAIDACRPRVVHIKTEARSQGQRVIVDIVDDGPGVPQEAQSRIFEPLVSGRKGGTGIGLALALRIAEAHGGSLVLVPSASGAHFRLELPAASS